MNEAKKVVDKKIEAIRTTQIKWRKLQKRGRKLAKARENTQKEIKTMKQMLRKSTKSADEFGERPETKVLESKTAAYLKDEIQSKGQELESLKNTNINLGDDFDLEELELLLEEAYQIYTVAQTEVKRAEDLQRGLKERLKARLQRYKRFRHVWYMPDYVLLSLLFAVPDRRVLPST